MLRAKCTCDMLVAVGSVLHLYNIVIDVPS